MLKFSSKDDSRNRRVDKLGKYTKSLMKEIDYSLIDSKSESNNTDLKIWETCCNISKKPP